MADEITFTQSINVTLSTTRQRQFRPVAQRLDMTGSVVYHNDHSIGTSEENVTTLGDVALPALVAIRNTSSANYVQLGFATTVYPLALPPGTTTTIVLASGQSLFLKADTAACVCEIFATGISLTQA